jgi:hypothetical protein
MNNFPYDWIRHISEARNRLITSRTDVAVNDAADGLLEYAHIIEVLNENHPEILNELQDSILYHVYG